jgi:hypothetical protein
MLSNPKLHGFCNSVRRRAGIFRLCIDIAVKLLQHGVHVAAVAAPSHGRTAINGAAEQGLERHAATTFESL